MPVPQLKSMAAKSGKDLDTLEGYYQKAKKEAHEQDKGDNYAYIMGIVKNMAGLSETSHIFIKNKDNLNYELILSESDDISKGYAILEGQKVELQEIALTFSKPGVILCMQEDTGSVAVGAFTTPNVSGTTTQSIAPFVKDNVLDKKKKKKKVVKEDLETDTHKDHTTCKYLKDGKCLIGAVVRHVNMRNKNSDVKVGDQCMTNGEELTPEFYCYNFES